MTTYVYAITDAGHPLRLSGVAGVGDPAAPLRTVRAKDLCAVVSDAPAELRAKRRDVAAHQDVQERLLADGSCLPMRFGLVGPDDEQVAAVLEEQHDTYTQRLGELAGCREYHLKVTRDEEDLLREIVRDCAEVRRLNDHTRRNSGAYEDKLALGELISQEVRARQDGARADILARLAPAAVRIEDGEPTKRHFLTTSFLVAQDQAATFSQAVHTEAERRGDHYTFRLYGPLPPYSFV
ncbi:gas vesicle protein [Streptomyces nigrescens]|uniref:Gas vesicle protein n=2 Tax=Streptomyces TaxID=1883 RepID=A0ABN6QV91_STRNI|nr:GvpL/GvpF family gas vesicle protein [Streptomyces nigrescens]MEE4418477.1 GvpL/GvpF family gas vesicle protein [Streptomyces sp. DSM 41528]BDM69165.1 gas vesicle protein [Streptomyces nigrescens]